MITLEKIRTVWRPLGRSRPEPYDALQPMRDCLADESIIGPLLVGATTQLSLFDWQNKNGVWYMDTRPRKAGQAVLRLSDKVPSDFKGLKEEVFQISPDAANELQLNQRYTGQP